jgi:hypothetical protein
MSKWKALVVTAVLVTLSLGHAVVEAAPPIGWYWNPAESGRGFFIESDNGVTFIGAYLYDADGHATWYVAGGVNADPYNYTGPLYNKSNGQTLFGSYVAPGAANTVGDITVHFSDDTHATVTWPGGVVAIERHIFGIGPPDFEATAGWWWNADESGSGYSLEIQGSNLFIVGFMYDDAGRPVWYYTAGPLTDPVTYHGDVLQFANGQTIGGPYKPPGAPTKIGTVDISFQADNEATFTFTETSSSARGAMPKTGRSSRRPTTPQFPREGTYVFPGSFTGEIQAKSLLNVKQDTVTNETSLIFGIYQLVMRPLIPTLVGSYDWASGDFHLFAEQTQTSDFLSCKAELPDVTVPIAQVPHTDHFALLVNRHKKYNLTMAVPPGDFNYNVPGKCVDPDLREYPYNDPLAFALPFITRQGPIVGDRIRDTVTTPIVNTGGIVSTVTTFVDLTGVRP